MIDTKAMTNQLMDSMPQVLGKAEDAERAIDTIFSIIEKGLKNRDVVSMHGIGELRSEPGQGGKSVVFTPSSALLDGINE